MKRWLGIILCILLLLVVVAGCATEVRTPEKPAVELKSQSKEASTKKPTKITVTRVVDGDTIEVYIDGKTEKVRLIGVDTPESGKPFFEEATNKTKELVEGKQVQLLKDVSERDKYGRLLRYVFVGNTFVNAELVRQGYANVYTYPPDVKYSDLFLKYEREAREGNKGLWAQAVTPPQSSPQPTPQPLPQAKGKYVGSRNSDKYHYPSCVWAQKINPENQVWFSSEKDAQARGYVPCKVCDPPGTAVAEESVTSPQPAPAPPPQVQEPAPETLPVEATVHITNTGEKYHLAGCRYLSKSDIPISLSEAKVRGYTPCSVCSPPQ
jgi:micrococcal nuclease